MTRMTGPDCAVMCNLIITHTHTHTRTASVSRPDARASTSRDKGDRTPGARRGESGYDAQELATGLYRLLIDEKREGFNRVAGKESVVGTISTQ